MHHFDDCKNTAYLIPSDDPHLSEYVPAAYMRRGYLTDFHGSAGTALVLAHESVQGGSDEKRGAFLWTDSRLVCICDVLVESGVLVGLCWG